MTPQAALKDLIEKAGMLLEKTKGCDCDIVEGAICTCLERGKLLASIAQAKEALKPPRIVPVTGKIAYPKAVGGKVQWLIDSK